MSFIKDMLSSANDSKRLFFLSSCDSFPEIEVPALFVFVIKRLSGGIDGRAAQNDRLNPGNNKVCFRMDDGA